MTRLCSIEGCGSLSRARGWCGRHYARWKRTGSPHLAQPTVSPGWGHGHFGEGRFWTKARALTALRKYAADNPGPVPTSDHVYNALKKGRMDLPPAQRVLEYWHTMVRAWLAAGVDRSRIKFLNTRWSKAEKEFLLDHAGVYTLERIAKALGRSYGSVKSMIGAKGMKITARANQGFMSAQQIATEFNAPYSRVCDLLTAGVIKGFRHRHRRSWQVDPVDLTPAVIAEIQRPKQTHTSTPPAAEEYRKRYGLRRQVAKAVAA